ncbi:unnamed protein product [Spodoptera exigua]|nr:unnamed protein product [Spodoptera exigua]
MRKKQSASTVTKKLASSSAAVTTQEITPWSTPTSTMSEKLDSDMFSDANSDHLPVCMANETLSKSMDYTLTEMIPVHEMKESIEQLQLELCISQNELENVILENNDLRSQITKLSKENNMLKTLLSKTPSKKSKTNNSACKQKSRCSLQYSDINIMATPPRVSAINDKGIASIENHVALQENLLDLEMQLKTAKHEISKLNEQIGVLQQTLQTKQCGELQSLNDANCILNCNNNKIRRKLCVLTNGIPGDSLQAVEDTFGSQFQYIRYVLPNCNIKDLLDNINTKLVNYDLSDYCIVMLGGKDLHSTCNYVELIKIIRDALQHINHTNIIVCTPSYSKQN